MPRASGDLLSHLLGTMHLAGMVMFRAEFREPWSVMTPGTQRLAQVLPFRTEHIIPFHVIATGGCWLQMPEQEPVWLNEGDAVLMPYGTSHLLSGKEAAASVPLGQLLPRPPGGDDDLVVEYGGAGAVTSIICGFVQCDELLFNTM
ncbi:MAG: cupin domain-containing protein, partial [Stenotrophobium sp.]